MEVAENVEIADTLSDKLGKQAAESPMTGRDQTKQVTLKLRKGPTQEPSNEPDPKNSEKCADNSHELTGKGDLR